jgi:hypothetical protein
MQARASSTCPGSRRRAQAEAGRIARGPESHPHRADADVPHGATRHPHGATDRQAHGSRTLPGAVIGFAEDVRRFGRRLLADDAAPTIALAKNGFVVEALYAHTVQAFRACPRADGVPSRDLPPRRAPDRRGDHTPRPVLDADHRRILEPESHHAQGRRAGPRGRRRARRHRSRAAALAAAEALAATATGAAGARSGVVATPFAPVCGAGAASGAPSPVRCVIVERWLRVRGCRSRWESLSASFSSCRSP